MRDVEALGREPMGKLLLRLSTPSVVGMLVQSLYNVVDAFFVGRSVGPQGIAAVFSAFPIQIVVMAFALLLGSGGVSLISRSLGARDVDRAERALGTITSVSLILGAIMAWAIALFAEPLVRVLGASESIVRDSIVYVRIVGLSIPAFSYSIVSNSAARGEGNARLAMVTKIKTAADFRRHIKFRNIVKILLTKTAAKIYRAFIASNPLVTELIKILRLMTSKIGRASCRERV